MKMVQLNLMSVVYSEFTIRCHSVIKNEKSRVRAKTDTDAQESDKASTTKFGTSCHLQMSKG